MCLGIPARIIGITDEQAGLALAETGGVRRQINIAMLTLGDQSVVSLVGQWVLLHVGFALAIIDEQEALRSLALLEEMERQQTGEAS